MGFKSSVKKGFKKAVSSIKKNKKHLTKKNYDRVVKKASSALKSAKKYASIGKKIGSKYGGIGSALGTVAGAAHGLIQGSGDYTVKGNLSNQIPSFGTGGGVTVKHREYIGDITGTTDPFAVLAYKLNPGNKQFPFISNIANNFEEYQWNGVIFELKSISGVSTGSTNGAMGYMAMAANYNATSPNYSSKLQLENAEYAVSGPPSVNVILPIECKKSQTPLQKLYVNNGDIPDGQDARLYDLCNVNIAAGNQQAAYKIAELWISYSVTLYKPKFGYSTNSVYMTHVVATTGISTSNYFGTSQTVRLNSVFSPVLTATTITLPPNTPLGRYVLNYQASGTITLATGPVISATTNCSSSLFLLNDTVSQLQMPSANSTYVTATYYFEVTGDSPVLTMSGGTFPTSITSMDLTITMLNSRITT